MLALALRMCLLPEMRWFSALIDFVRPREFSGGKKEHKGKGFSSIYNFLFAPGLRAQPKVWAMGPGATMVDVKHRAGM